MQFNIMKLAVLLTASGFAFAAPAAEAGGDVVARDIKFGSFCAGSNCLLFTRPFLPSGCINNSPEWINDITSYTIDAGFKCTWFNFANCGGDAISTTGPANVNLMGTNFNKNLESYSCQFA
ncbi:hypothetical protein B0H13DRAFT_2058260 [Mycena leptocephala]|nr:hypothetical protein B0H13DRAFT_2058260 [Mycena leptocephala]